ncbi:MAG: hypothetical protein LBD73_02835 [Deferribacteraceae bacterium]|jgi:hypothetical protein|nr:hypothetical protein [Deferribacteraceae bacterium]
MRGLAFIFILPVLLLAGCDSSIYEKTIADDTSPEAKAEQLEIHLDNKEYGKIISVLERSDGVYTSYTDREKYLLQLAYLGSTGFDLLDNLEDFLGDDDKELTDVFIKSIAGSDGFADTEIIDKKRDVYTEIISIDANYNPDRDHDIAFIAGLTASIDTIMLIGNFAQEALNDILGGSVGGVAIENISFSSDDPNYIGKVFEEIANDPDTAKADDLRSKIEEKIETIINNVVALEDTVKLLLGSDSSDTLDELEEFLDDMRKPAPCDKNTDADHCIDKDSVYDFIMEKIAS